MTEVRRGKSRIIDIALQAGVSTATVDRVLNRRPGVRQKTIDRVHDAMRWLDKAPVRPTVIPSVAADLTIDVVIAGEAGFANAALASELRLAASRLGLTLRPAYPKRMDPGALADALRKGLQQGGSGFIVQPLDHHLVREALAEIRDRDLPVITILTDLPGADVMGYSGLDNRSAGRTAGLLMGRLCKQAGEVATFWGGGLYRSHEEREIGFRSVIRDEFPELSLLGDIKGRDDPHRNYELAKTLLASNRNLRGIYNVGGGNRGIEKALIESGRAADITYVAFNLTPLTKQALLNGTIDAVVHQDMARVAHLAVTALVDNFTGKPVAFPNVPVEIIMRENIR